MQAIPSYFTDILTDTPLDASTADYSYAEYRTSDLNISSGNVQSGSNYHIGIQDTNQWLLWSKAYLQIRAKIITSAGGELPNDNGNLVTLAAAGAGVFSRVELLANDSLIDSCDNPGLVQLMNCLLTYSKDKIDSVAESEWLSLDFAEPSTGPVTTAAAGGGAIYNNAPAFSGSDGEVITHNSGIAEPRQYVLAAAGGDAGGRHPLYNKGFAMRWFRSRPTATPTSRTFEFQIPLSSILGFCRDIKTVQRGMKWDLNFSKNINYASILHGASTVAAGAQVLLKKISLWIPAISPSLETMSMLEKSISQGNTSKQVFENMSCRVSEEYAAGINEVEMLVPTEGKKPTRMVFFVRRKAQYNTQNDPAVTTVNGQLQLSSETHANPSTFSTLCDYSATTHLYTNGIVAAQLKINSKSLPREAYVINFSDDAPEYQRNYNDFLKLSGAFAAEIGSAVSYHDFKELYPSFCFDLTDYADVFSNQRSNDIRFRLRIAGAGSPSAFQVYCVVYSERELIVQALGSSISLKV